MPSNSSKDYYYIIRQTPNNETLIIEYGFLDNLDDANRLKNNYKRYAEAVVRAVTNYAGYKYVPTNSSEYYIVKKGDTLWSIAKNNNISVNKLKEINNLNSNILSIGDTLIVKDDNEVIDNNNYYIVKKGDTLWSIAKQNNTTVNKIKLDNNLTSNTLSIGQKILLDNYYIVKKGDTLWSIAKQNNTTVNKIKLDNNLTSNTLSVGQKIKL